MYEITIKKKTIKKVTEEGDWEVIDKRPFTKEELVEASTSFLNAGNRGEKESLIKEVMGYTPEKVVEHEFEEKVYQQRIEELDLPAVIKAINEVK